MGLCCSGCGCDGGCSEGLVLFDSGTDYTQWAWPEWAVVGVGVYALLSMWTTTNRGVRAVREGVGRGRRKVGGAISGSGGSRKKK